MWLMQVLWIESDMVDLEGVLTSLFVSNRQSVLYSLECKWCLIVLFKVSDLVYNNEILCD